MRLRRLLASASLLLPCLAEAAEPPAPPPPAAEAAPSPLTLAEVFATLRTRHPALASAKASTEAARARIDQEKAWADPRLTLSANRAGDGMHLPDTTNLAKVNEFEVMVSQEIPLSGRPRLRAEAAAAEVGVASAQARRREWMLLNQARLAFTRLAAADTRLAVNTRLRENLSQTLALARLGYESGQRPQSEVLALETDRAKLDADRSDLEGMRAREAAELNALMLRPATTAIASLSLPEPAAPATEVADMISRARALSPDIAIALRETEAAQARLAVAKKNRAIDPEFSVTARQMRGDDQAISSYDTAISFSLPWAHPGRTRAELSEARARVAAARAEVEAGEAEIAGMVASAHARAASSFAQATRYQNEIIPLARASAEAARRDYEAGRAALTTILEAQRMNLEAEEKLVDLRAENALAAAELCFLSGQDVQP